MSFKSSSRYVSAILIFLVLFLSAAISHASAPAGYSEYFIPGDEGNMYTLFDTLDTGAIASSNMHAVISVTAWSDNITLYYDHWENGYNFDPTNPAATADEVYTFATAGSQRTFESASIPLPTSVQATCSPAGTCYYDGGDRIYVAGGPVTVTRTSWVNATGIANQAASWEIYPVKPQLTTYVIPFGENFGVTYPDFSRVFALIQATEENTIVTVDLNGDGTPDLLNIDRDATKSLADGDTTSVTLNKGQTFLLGFCLQDTYFKMYQDRNNAARAQLGGPVSRPFLETPLQLAGPRWIPRQDHHVCLRARKGDRHFGTQHPGPTGHDNGASAEIIPFSQVVMFHRFSLAHPRPQPDHSEAGRSRQRSRLPPHRVSRTRDRPARRRLYSRKPAGKRLRG